MEITVGSYSARRRNPPAKKAQYVPFQVTANKPFIGRERGEKNKEKKHFVTTNWVISEENVQMRLGNNGTTNRTACKAARSHGETLRRK